VKLPGVDGASPVLGAETAPVALAGG